MLPKIPLFSPDPYEGEGYRLFAPTIFIWTRWQHLEVGAGNLE
jgi:hypothetical protein